MSMSQQFGAIRTQILQPSKFDLGGCILACERYRCLHLWHESM